MFTQKAHSGQKVTKELPWQYNIYSAKYFLMVGWIFKYCKYTIAVMLTDLKNFFYVYYEYIIVIFTNTCFLVTGNKLCTLIVLGVTTGHNII